MGAYFPCSGTSSRGELRMDREQHWQSVYTRQPETGVSWYQASPEPSLGMIRAAAPAPEAALIDVGGGASTLVDHLLAAGYRDVTVLDIAEAALAAARRRLGARAAAAQWIAADVTAFAPPRRYQVWHDRAVLHFLTDEDDRARYREALDRALAPDGTVVIGAFAPDGPERCSGLPVRRYSADGLAEFLGAGYPLEETQSVAHRTPSGAAQQFLFCRFRRRAVS